MAEPVYHEWSYKELREEYLKHLYPETIDQCKRLLRVVAAFDLIRPREMEKGGERLSTSELNKTREMAHKRLGLLCLQARPFPVILPQDQLR